MKSRRQALKTAAGVVTVLPVLQAQHEHPVAAKSAAAYKFKWLTADEQKLLAEICDMILPRTDTPGASDAKVHEYIDFTLQPDKKRQDQMREGLKWMAAIKPDRRLGILQSASEKPATEGGRFFTLLKDLTIDGYYTSREGLHQELGWNANTFVADFKGCTHPEHQS